MLINEQLKHLAIIAQRHPPLSVERQEALTEIVSVILRSGKLRLTHESKLYKEVYEEAIQNLFLYVCQNIEKYDPSRAPFMSWIYMLLYKDFMKKAMDERQKQLKTTIKSDNLLENLSSPEEAPFLSEILRETIEADLDNLFKKEYVFSHCQANFQSLMIKRISGESWQEISLELGIKVSTLSSFYQRCIDKYICKFKEYLSY